MAGATSGRLREPMSAATATPVGGYKTIHENLFATVKKRVVLLFLCNITIQSSGIDYDYESIDLALGWYRLSLVWFECHFDRMDFHLWAGIALCWHLFPFVCLTPPLSN